MDNNEKKDIVSMTYVVVHQLECRYQLDMEYKQKQQMNSNKIHPCNSLVYHQYTLYLGHTAMWKWHQVKFFLEESMWS